MSNLNINKAKALKNDEFYTRLEDIENEMPYYTKYFKNATVYCNCDNPAFSNFWRFFHINFKKLGLKKLWATYINLDGSSSCLVEYTGGHDSDIFTGEVIPLKGNGDFRSKECVDLLRKADVVVTNPPFSLFRDFVDLCVKNKAKFLILGNVNASSCKNIFSLFKANEIWYGVSLKSGGIPFLLSKNNSCAVYSGKVFVKWFTNLKHDFPSPPLNLTKKYNPMDYPKYDNYEAVEVSRVKNIPCDYWGVMGVPITFLAHYNPNQFEIVGSTNLPSSLWKSSRTKHALLKDIDLYQRIFIKRKK